MRKVNAESTVKGVGIAPPLTAPYAEVVNINFNQFNAFSSTTSMTVTGSASSPTEVSRSPVGVTIQAILYDIAGWLCFVPSTTGGNLGWLQPGMLLLIQQGANQDECHVSQVLNAIQDTTIAGIMYDTGTSGDCTITLANPTQGLTRNSIVQLNGTEYVRVLSTSLSPDGTYSFRCSTGGTFSVGQSVAGMVSVRTHTSFTGYTAGATVTATSVRFTVTPSPSTPQGALVCNITTNLAVCLDRPTQPDDYFHLSIMLDNPANVLFGRLLFDVDATTNDFTQNYYQKVFTPSDFQSMVTGGASSITPATANASQVQLVQQSGVEYVSSDIYTADSSGAFTNQSTAGTPQQSQLSAGENIWTELVFRVSDLMRVGADTTRSLADVQKYAIELTCIDEVNCTVSSYWLGGTYGPDTDPGNPVGIMYRYRYRDSTTGASSIPGPAIRYNLYPLRQGIYCQPTLSSDTQVDTIDFERFDPNLQAEGQAPIWKYVGSCPNTVGTFLFDQYTVAYIASNPPLDTTNIVPFAVEGPPLKGVVNVVGTSVEWVSGDQFPTNLLQNTIVLINGVAYQTFGTPAATRLELTQSGGTIANAAFEIQSPTLFGTPLPIIFGPLSGSSASFTFGLGDKYNPGRLYWMNGNNNDGASDANYIEVTSPSEPLVSGCVWNNYVFVASRDRLFSVQPSFNQPNQFTALELPSPSGVWSSWGMQAGIDGVYYLGRDGVYRATPYYGGQLLTKDLYPIFPHAGIPGVATNGIAPPNMALDARLRIGIADSDIYFDYVDTNGVNQTLRSAPTAQNGSYSPQQSTGWFPYTYGHGVEFHYWEESPPDTTPRLIMGTVDGYLACDGVGSDDIDVPITCTVLTPSLTADDSRAQKLYVDYMNDFQGSLTSTIKFNFNEQAGNTVTVVSAQRGQLSTPVDSISGLALFLNVSVLYQFSPGTFLYEFQPSFYLQPYLIKSLVTQYKDHGMPFWKQQRYGHFAYIAPNGPVTLEIRTSDGRVYDYTLPTTSVDIIKASDFNINALQKGELFAYSLTSDSAFVFFPQESVIRMKPWGGKEFVEVRPFVD